MKYKIQKTIFDNYPDLRIGILVGRDLNIRENEPNLSKTISQNINIFLGKYDSNNLLEHPNIKAWRETYKSFGVKPKDHKPTAEALLRRVINDHPFPKINTAVDAYLAVELLFLLPIGGYDLDKVEGDIILRYSEGEETFHPLGGAEIEKTNSKEVVYADNNKILTRRWNYKDSDISKISVSSKNILLACEAAFKEIETADVENTIKKIIEYEEAFCGGTYKSFFLDKSNNEVEL